MNTARRGRGARRQTRQIIDHNMLPALRRKMPVTELMNAEEVARIDGASMDILENVGVHFRDKIALDDWRRAGAKIKGERVYLDRALVRELIKNIPESFTYHARDPQKKSSLW